MHTLTGLEPGRRLRIACEIQSHAQALANHATNLDTAAFCGATTYAVRLEERMMAEFEKLKGLFDSIQQAPSSAYVQVSHETSGDGAAETQADAVPMEG